jgi:DNA polymerase-4
MIREILHLTIPAYAVAVARVVDAALRERPVAIALGDSERALLQCVSREATREGVMAGMSVRQARRYCPALVVLSPDPRLLSRANRALFGVVNDYSPLVEPSRDGQMFLDMTGCRRLFGPGRDVAMRLEKDLESRLRLTATLGVAGNKLVSKIAAGCLERPGVCDVLHGAERSFIAPLPVSVLPGIGEVRQGLLLQELNLRQVQELAALTLPQLRLVFGPFAPLAQQRALGNDPSPVCPPKKTPEVVAEAFLAREENDDAILLAELCRLVEDCGLRLRQLQRGTSELQLTIHYADGVRQSGLSSQPVPQNHDLLLYAAAEQLFGKLCTRRTRVKQMQLACRKLGHPDFQVDLFTRSGPSPNQQSLQQAIDALRCKYGMQVVKRGHTLVS